MGMDYFRFSELFANMVNLHGIEWVYEQCVDNGNMQPWEFRFWAGHKGLQ
jgi:hypothetical protein